MNVFKKRKQPEPIALSEKKTMPSVGLDDPSFRYTPAIKTNIAETWKRALDDMGERTRERVAA